MQAALAQIADRPVRRRRRATPWVVLASMGAHLLVLGGLVAGVQVMPPLVEPPALSVELLRPVEPAKQEAPPAQFEPATRPLQPAAAWTIPAAPVVAAPVPRPSPPTSATAPPGFKARGLTGGGEALRQAAREGMGCRNADLLALTKTQRAACDEALGEKHKNGPAMYAVIDPDKKAAFDGDCKKEDDWCLYRIGKGPYPGILALGRKKKRDGW